MVDHLATIDIGRKGGSAVSLSGRVRELDPHLTQCHLGRGLPPYQVASWSILPFGHNRHGPKIGMLLCPFFRGKLGPHVTQYACAEAYPRTKWHLDPCSRLATIHGPKLRVLSLSSTTISFELQANLADETDLQNRSPMTLT